MSAFPADNERLLITLEIRQFFHHRRMFHFIPLLLAGIFLTAWIYPVGSPFAPVIIVVMIGLELQFNNILYRTPNELDALCLFPVSWERIILIKNIGTTALAVLLLVMCAMVLLFFSPEVITFGSVMNACCYFITIIFPLLHFGNEQSIGRPRRMSGMLLDDVVEAVWMMVNLFLVSIPAFILIGVVHVPVLCLVYGVATAAYWYRVSLRKAADKIEKEQAKICSRV